MMKTTTNNTIFWVMTTVVFFVLLIVARSTGSVHGRSEEERVNSYHAMNYTWPPQNSEFIPNTRGWRKLYEHRLRQVAEIEDRTDRFEGFAQVLSSGVLQKNFTEHGKYFLFFFRQAHRSLLFLILLSFCCCCCCCCCC